MPVDMLYYENIFLYVFLYCIYLVLNLCLYRLYVYICSVSVFDLVLILDWAVLACGSIAC